MVTYHSRQVWDRIDSDIKEEKVASLTGSVGDFVLWELRQFMMQHGFVDLKGPKAIRLSERDFFLGIHAFGTSAGNLAFGAKPAQQ